MAVIFFFNDTATTEIYTLSLHDALPICPGPGALRRAARDGLVAWAHPDHPAGLLRAPLLRDAAAAIVRAVARDRKSTRLNSSHANISYAVFCLKKKNRS